MSAHTPGPWTVRKSLADGTFTHISAKTNNSVACTKSVADARLIAAAPSMLKALELAALALAGADASRQPAYEAVAAAIAMATDERALLTSCDDRR